MGQFEQALFFASMAVALGFAFWKGGEPERYGAAVILLMVVISGAAEIFLPSSFSSLDPFSLLTDFAGMVGFGMLALEARRIWPLWATSLQLLCVSAHFARWADIGIPAQVYAVMRGAPTFLVLLVLTVGTMLHVMRLHRRGSDRSWQDWSLVAAGSGRSRSNYSKRW